MALFNLAYFGLSEVNNGTTPEVPGESGDVEAQTYDILETGLYMFAILITAISISVLAGTTILGSGLSDTAQTVIVNGSMWLGLWFALTVGADNFIFAEGIATFAWLILTALYVIGIANQITGSGTSG